MSAEITGVRRVGDISLMSDTKGNVMEYVEEYTVQTDTPYIIQWHVMRDAVTGSGVAAQLTYTPNTTLPFPSYTVSSDGLAVCKSLNGRREERNANVWIFEAVWSTSVPEGNQQPDGQPPVDPTAIEVQRKTMFDIVRRPRPRDYTGRTYTNSAGNLIVPALEAEEEISRWEWTQYEPMYTGSWTNIGTLLSPDYIPASPAVIVHEARQLTFDSGSMARVVPPGIYADDTYSVMIGVTDNTVEYFNGAINLFPFKGCPAFTLKLEVVESVVGRFYGVYGRRTTYALQKDYKTWLDRAVNAGPYFLAPKLDTNGDLLDSTDPTKLIQYPYIYYVRDEETDSDPLSIDEQGPLGFFANAPGYSGAATACPDGGSIKLYNRLDTLNTAFSTAPYDDLFGAGSAFGKRGVILPELGSIGVNPFAVHRYYLHDLTTGRITASPFTADYDAQPIGGSVKVKNSQGEWTLRAKRPPTTIDWPYIEYLNRSVFDFNGYLKVKYGG